jgi:hypothetical protein
LEAGGYDAKDPGPVAALAPDVTFDKQLDAVGGDLVRRGDDEFLLDLAGGGGEKSHRRHPGLLLR